VVAVANNQVNKSLLLSQSAKRFFFKSVNISRQSYKQERGCLVQFVRLVSTLLEDEENRDLVRYFGPRPKG